jgi:hypothetical protein
VYVRRTLRNGRVKPPNTKASMRAGPLQAIALAALDQLPGNQECPLLFPSAEPAGVNVTVMLLAVGGVLALLGLAFVKKLILDEAGRVGSPPDPHDHRRRCPTVAPDHRDRYCEEWSAESEALSDRKVTAFRMPSSW